MDDILNKNIENRNTNWNISGFDINKKKSEIIQELNIPNNKKAIVKSSKNHFIKFGLI